MLEENLKLKNIISNKKIFSEKIKNKISSTKIKNIICKKTKKIKSNIKNKILIKRKGIINNKKRKEDILDNEKNKIVFFCPQKNKKQKIIELKTIKKDISVKKPNKIISITGNSGVGKSIFISVLSLHINSKILVIDFDLLNKSLKTVYGVKEMVAEDKENWQNDTKNIANKISDNIDLISGVEYIFEDKYKMDVNKFNDFLNYQKDKYELIIIDTSSECFFDFNRNIFLKSDKLIFLSEANLSELKKSKRLLDIYINNWQINKERFGIIFNKFNEGSIHQKILEKLFKDFKILGYLKMNKNYNCLINNNINFIDKKIEKEIKTIAKKLEEEIYKT